MENTHEINIAYVTNLLAENKFGWINYNDPIDINFFKSGGGTHLYLIVNADKKFIARINYYTPKNEWGVKKQEYDVLKLIEPLNISPKVHYFSNKNSINQDITIVDYIEGETLEKISNRTVALLAKDLLTLHTTFTFTKSGNSIPPTDDAPYHCDIYNEFANGEDKKIEKYTDLTDVEKITKKFNKINKNLGKWFNSLQIFDSVTNFCLCHADLKKENILVTNNGIMLIDWECAGSDIPETDIGRLFSGCQLTKKQQEVFLKNYYGTTVAPITLQRIYAIKIVLDFFRILEDYILIKRKSWHANNMLIELCNFEKKLQEAVKNNQANGL